MAESFQVDQPDQNFIITVILGLFILVIGGYYLFVKSTTSNDESNKKEQSDDSPKEEKQPAKTPNNKTKAANSKKQKIVKDLGMSHKLLVASLKGHTGNVLNIDLSSNGKYVASCSEDRTVRLWNIKDFTEKDHKYSRVNVEFDHASSISFSPDSRAFVVSLSTERTIRIFKIHKEKKEGTASLSITHEFDFPKVHKADIINVAISSNGKFIMSADRETQIIVWNLKGDVLNKIDTLLIYNLSACISPCGNLIAACGFTSEVKLWHVGFTKTGDFQQVTKGLEIKGHKAGVLSFSFSNDSKRLATASKDGTWKVWDINVNYLKGQDAYLLHTGSFEGYQDGTNVQVALTHNHFIVAVSVGRNIFYYNVNEGKLKESLEEVHQGDISALAWSSDSRVLISSGGTDKMIRAWHNPPGVEASLVDLNEKLLKANSDSMRERISDQIKEARGYLSRFA